MNLNKNVAELLEALEHSKAHVPQDLEYLSNNENVMFQVMEMEYMPKPLSEHLGVSKELFYENNCISGSI